MRSMLFASLLLTAAAACSSDSAFADQVASPQQPGPRTALAIANAKVRAPYDVQVIRENGETLPTYAMKDRFYVQGNLGERYVIRVTNPTANRVEAVVAVDGLDVIDGDEGDLHKRGYIVPPYGDVRIEGFRTSLVDVATFRFSGVDGSYAGKQGKARNVGVIAVAIFEEQAQPEQQQQQIIVGDGNTVTPPPPPPPTTRRPYDYSDDLDVSKNDRYDGRGHQGGKDKGSYRAAADAPAAPPPAPTTTASARPAGGPSGGGGYYGGNGAPAAKAAPPPQHRRMEAEADEGGLEEKAPSTGRLGLGTQFGEQRTSSATYTRFVRSPGRPVAIAELRYNDAAGLTALGINVQPLPDEGEIMTRETADPFPGDRHFSHAR
jgi:hypothetical protein